MPGLSGEQLARAISEIAPGTPVILLTGFGDEMQARGQMPEGIALIVGKPVTAADLRRAVLQATSPEEAAIAVAADRALSAPRGRETAENFSSFPGPSRR